MLSTIVSLIEKPWRLGIDRFDMNFSAIYGIDCAISTTKVLTWIKKTIRSSIHVHDYCNVIVQSIFDDARAAREAVMEFITSEIEVWHVKR